MSGLGARIDLGDLTVDAGQSHTPFVQNVELGDADEETELVLPAHTKKYEVRARGLSSLKVAFAAAAAAYRTVPAGTVYKEDHLDTPAPLSLFVRATKASEILEVTYWT